MSFWRIFFPYHQEDLPGNCLKSIHIFPKPLNANLSVEREGVAGAEMPQKPFKCYVAGFFSPHYVKVDKYRHFSRHYPIVSQWSKCQSLQIMSSQCLATQTVIYRSIFLVFLKKFLSTIQGFLCLLFLGEFTPLASLPSLLDTVIWGTVLEAHINQGRNFLDTYCPLAQV